MSGNPCLADSRWAGAEDANEDDPVSWESANDSEYAELFIVGNTTLFGDFVLVVLLNNSSDASGAVASKGTTVVSGRPRRYLEKRGGPVRGGIDGGASG